MNNLEELKLLFKCENLSEDWYLSYGITRKRNDNLTRPDIEYQNSFYNPHSETALTLFMLGNIDYWKQIGRLNITPRMPNEDCDWDREFFDKIRNNQDIFNTISKTDIFWENILKEKINNKNINFQKSILLFEFRIMNNAFHPHINGTYKKLSFTDIHKNQRWSQFDAVLMIPCDKLFVFFESKLCGYDNPNKKTNNIPHQIIRNLESAYLLTNHEDSLYDEWDFIYVFISPSKIKYSDKYYSILDNAGIVYEEILEEMKKSSSYYKYFESFKNDISKHIIKKHWNDVGKVLKKNNPNFFNDYFNNLKNSGIIGEKQIENIRERFRIAEIEL